LTLPYGAVSARLLVGSTGNDEAWVSNLYLTIKKSYAMQKEIILRLRRIDHLIRIKGTGNPAH